MSIPVEVSYQDLQPSALVEQRVREHLRELAPIGVPIIKCHVTLRPHHHYRQGDLYQVQVELHFADGTLVVGRERPAEHAHEDPRVALRDTFAAVRSRLEERVRHGAGTAA